MTTGVTCTMVLAAQLAVGGLGLFDCLKKNRHDYSGPECCHPCLSEHRTVRNLLAVMQHHANWKKRDDAAHALRKYDWRCHPEIVPALAFTLLNDCRGEVRREAAETLAKLAPCDATAHVSLRQAALSDPHHGARKWARKALDRLDRRCPTSCSICGPAPGIGPAVVAAPVPVGYEIEALPSTRAPRIYGEVPYDREAPLLDREWPALPPGGLLPLPSDPGPAAPAGAFRDSYRPEFPGLPDPNARPGLLPEALPPAEGPIEILPPELPPPAPPAASPFGASRGPGDPERRPARQGGPVRLSTIGRPR